MPTHIIGRVQRLFGTGQKANRWFAGVIKSNIGDIRIAGVADTRVVLGSRIEFDGEFESSSYGDRYVPVKGTMIHRVLTSETEVVQFLSSKVFSGIGPKTAEKLYSLYGQDTLIELWKAHDSDYVYNTIKKLAGLTDKQMTVLLDGLAADKGFVQLMQAFPSMRPPTAQKIVDQLNSNALDLVVDRIRKSPYCVLCDEFHIAFADADMIAVNDILVNIVSYMRIGYMIKMAIRRFCSDRHATFVRISDSNEWRVFFIDYFLRCGHSVALPEVWDGEEFDENCLAKHIQAWFNAGYSNLFFVSDVRKDISGLAYEVGLYATDMYDAENELRKFFKSVQSLDVQTKDTLDMRYQKFLQWYRMRAKTTGLSLSDEQVKAVGLAYQNQVLFISGGPGRGKTSALQVLIESWAELVSNSILCLAPTGKAVNRLKAQTGFNRAGTVARFLKLNQGSADSVVDVYSQRFRAELSSLIIVDEASMLNFLDASRLIGHLKDCTLVFVGDKDQLSPIEPGPFLQECLASKSVVRQVLTKNFRTKSRVINDNAEKILNGDSFKSLDLMDFDAFSVLASDETVMDGKDCSPAEMYILDKYLNYLADGAAFSDIMVISPFVSEKYRLSSYNLNQLIQSRVNPACPSNSLVSVGHDDMATFIDKKGFDVGIKDMDGIPIRIGDRLMNVKNNMDVVRHTFKHDNAWSEADMLPEDETNEGIFNGDVGTVVKYYNPKDDFLGGALLIALDDTRSAEQKILDPKPTQYVLVPADIDRYGKTKLTDWCLGYALSVHKAQGSEAEYVILALSQRGYESTNYRVKMGGMPFLTRNMLYTAITRAKLSVSIVGSIDALKACMATPYEFSNVRLAYDLDNS